MSPSAASAQERAQWAASAELHGPPFDEPERPAPRLMMFGAVPLAAALCGLAQAVGWRPYVVDPRERFARPDLFPGAEEVLVAWPEEAFERLAPIDEATSVAVLAHDPIVDDPALLIALRSPACYVGAMGSRRTQARRRERLLQAGLRETELERLSGPAGLDLGAVTAAETALSILSEAVAAHRGRAGGRLTASEQHIHVSPVT
ncbi:MAG: XdhC family protein [Solirubrobacteraceae bacterium]